MVWALDRRLGVLWKWSGCMTQQEESLHVTEIRLLITGSLLTDNKCSVCCCKRTVNCLLAKGTKVLLSLYTPRNHTAETEVWLHSFLNLALQGGEWSAPSPRHFTPQGGTMLWSNTNRSETSYKPEELTWLNRIICVSIFLGTAVLHSCGQTVFLSPMLFPCLPALLLQLMLGWLNLRRIATHIKWFIIVRLPTRHRGLRLWHKNHQHVKTTNHTQFLFFKSRRNKQLDRPYCRGEGKIQGQNFENMVMDFHMIRVIVFQHLFNL
jgi:hypothetical protein